MNCRELVERITDYLEEQLPPDDTRRLEQHLAECPHCGVYLEQMRAIVRTIGKLEEEHVHPEARQRLLEIFRRWKEGD